MSRIDARRVVGDPTLDDAEHAVDVLARFGVIDLEVVGEVVDRFAGEGTGGLVASEQRGDLAPGPRSSAVPSTSML